MKHTKPLLMILLVAFLLVGLGTLAASDVTKNDTSVTKSADVTKTNTVSKDTTSASKVSTTKKDNDNTDFINSEENKKTNKIKEDNTIKKVNLNKTSTKTASKTYDVYSFEQLNEYLTNDDYSTVTLNLQSNIYLNNNTILNDSIRKLTINGNAKTINGQDSYQFLNVTHGTDITLNNISITNCKSDDVGGVIAFSKIFNDYDWEQYYNDYYYDFYYDGYFHYEEFDAFIYNLIYTPNYSTLTITNSNFSYNNALNYSYQSKCGGVISGDRYSCIRATITNTNFYKNSNINPESRSRTPLIGLFNSNLNIQRCNFTENNGGIEGWNTNTTVQNSLFLNNRGSVISSRDLNFNVSNLNIINCNFTNNTSPNGSVGAVSSQGYVTLRIRNSNFKNNDGKTAGALEIYSLTDVIISNCNFTENKAYDDSPFAGGAIYTNANLINIIDCSFNKNTAQEGGAIGSFSFLNITRCNFTENVAYSERYIYNGGGAINTLSRTNISDSIFINNSASNKGGAINSINGNDLIIDNSTFINNYANKSGGVFSGTWMTNLDLKNSRFIDNYVTSHNGTIIDFSSGFENLNITNNYFENNTDYTRDMLFSNHTENTNFKIEGNTYTRQYLEVDITPINDIPVILDDEDRVLEYTLKLDIRDIYNDTVRNGTVDILVNNELTDSVNVEDGISYIKINNKHLTQRDNNITLNYVSPGKHYQNKTYIFEIIKEVNTTLAIQAPSNMIAGDIAQINFTLVDVNGNPLNNEIIHVFVNEENVENITTGADGIATFEYTASGDELVRIEGTHHTSSNSMYISAIDVVAEIDVTKVQPEITITANSLTLYTESEIIVNLFDHNGKPIPYKTLNIKITEEGKPDIVGNATTDENGKGVFKFTPVDEETIWINATFPGDEIYHYASESMQTSPVLISTNVEIIASSTKINQTNSIRVEIFATDGKRLKGAVELNIDGEVHNIEINNGIGTFNNYKSNIAGEKRVTATFTPTNSSYGQSTGTEEFNVEKLPTRVIIESVNNTPANVTLKVKVFPEDSISSIVDGGELIIKSVNGSNEETIYSGTLSNGELIYKTNIEEAGFYDFAVVYHGNDFFYGEQNNTGNVEVTLINTNTRTYNKVAKIGDTITLNATVSDENGETVNTDKVSFYLNDKQLYHENGSPVEANVIEGVATTDYVLPASTTAGTYKITAKYNGNKKYEASTNDAVLEVNALEAKMTTEILNNTRGNTTIKVDLTSPTENNRPIPNSEVQIKDKNGKTLGESTTDQSGTALIIIDLPLGTEELTIVAPSNGTYEEKTTTKEITVIPKETTVNIKDAVNNTAGNVIIPIEVKDTESGEPVSGGNITVKLSNGTIIANIPVSATGTTLVPLDIDNAGKYDLTVTYTGDENNKPVEKTIPNFEVDKHKININITEEDGKIKVNVTDDTGKPVPGIQINITDENGTVIGSGTTGTDGTTTIPIDTTSGDHEITITTPGDGNNEGTSITIPITVPSKETNINVTVTDPTKGNTTIKVNATDADGKPISEIPIEVKLPNGTTVTAKTDKTGTVTIPLDLPTGNSNVTISTPGDGKHDPKEITVTVKVEKIPTNTTITLTNTTAGNVTATGRVLDKYGKAVNEGTVTIKNGQSPVGTTTVKNGQYSVTTNIGSKGTYTLTAEYSGTNNYLPSSSQATTTSVSAKTPVISTDISGDQVGKVNVTTTIKDPNGQGVPNAEIIVTLPNGSTVSNKTNDKGVANIAVDLREGTNSIKVEYKGNGTYNQVSTQETITVSKNRPVIKLNPVKGVIGETITLTAYLTDEDGTPITGGNLAFKLNGKTLRSDGRFDSTAPAMKFAVKDGKVTYTIKADLYLRNAKNLTAAYSGNYKYEETNSESVEAQIQKRYAGVTVTVTPTKAKQYETLTFTATVRDTTKNGKNTTLINQDTKVMFKVNGVTLTDKNGKILYVNVDKNKQAIYNYTIPAGTGGITPSKKTRDYKVEAIFVGINYYPGSRNSSKFNVERSNTTVTIQEAKVTTKTNVLSVKATLTDYKGNNLIGTNKVTIKINGKNYVNPTTGKAVYWSVKNGVVNLTGIQVDSKTTIKRVMVVTGERQAYEEGRAETTNIIRA